MIEQAAEGDPAFAGSARVLASREPFEIGETEQIVQAVRHHGTAILGQEPELVGAPFWADSALLGEAGIPTVLFGPRGEGAHAEVEWVELDALERCIEIYVAVASELCA